MAKEQINKIVNRRQLARREREQHTQRMLVWITAGVLAVILLIIGYGVVTELLIKARRPVAQVGTVTVTTKDYQNRLRYERKMRNYELMQYQMYLSQIDTTDETMAYFTQQLQYQISNLQSQLSPDMAETFGKQVLDRMIEEELVRQESQVRGITLDQDTIERELELTIGYDRDATPAPTSEVVTETTEQQPMTDAEYKQAYRNFKTNILAPSQLQEAEYRNIIAVGLLQEKLLTVLAQDVISTAEQIQVTLLVTDTEVGAQTLRDQINEGANVVSMTNDLNADASDVSYGYELPWVPAGYLSEQLSAEIESVAFNTPLGKASDPISQTIGGFYVVYVQGHEVRELSESFFEDARQAKYDEWLEQQKAAIVEYLNWEEAVLTD
ncbi:MAG TPA: hypothetical protein PKH77_03705 [Anaerolineae bacterium]|nr:hypothetical protein [Anaerolineae bacterium]